MFNNDPDHPWSSCGEDFDLNILPLLKEHGKNIGIAASNGDENSKQIMTYYNMLLRSFDPMTVILLDESLKKYLDNVKK